MPDLPCYQARSSDRSRGGRSLQNIIDTPFYADTGPAAGWLDPIVWQLETTPFTIRPDAPPPPLRGYQGGPAPAPPQVPLHQWDPFDCFWWTVCLRAVYSGDWNDLRTALAARSSPAGFSHRDSAEGLLDPAFGWANLEDRFVVVVRGTDQTSQAANYVLRHAYDSVVGIGPWGTINAAWSGPGSTVAFAVAPDWQAAGKPPLCMIGHSYGAPAAAVAFMLMTDPGRNRLDRIVTAGSPLWGTSSLVGPWSPTQHVRLVVRGDPIVQIPPPASIVTTLLRLGILPAAALGQYVHLAPGLELTPNSGIQPRATTDLGAADWLIAASQIFIGQAGFDPHYAGTYADLAARWLGLNPIPLPQAWNDFPSLIALNDKLRAAGL